DGGHKCCKYSESCGQECCNFFAGNICFYLLRHGQKVIHDQSGVERLHSLSNHCFGAVGVLPGAQIESHIRGDRPLGSGLPIGSENSASRCATDGCMDYVPDYANNFDVRFYIARARTEKVPDGILRMREMYTGKSFIHNGCFSCSCEILQSEVSPSQQWH